MLRKLRSLHRVLAMCVVGVAAVGSWTLATSPTPANGGPNSVGVHALPLEISNPYLAAGVSPQFPAGGQIGVDGNGFDAGDACPGGTIDRFLTGLGGIEPYTFSSATVGSLNLSLSNAGRLTGMINQATPVSQFTANLKDAAGTVRIGNFFLSEQNCGTFHFAQDSLSRARIGEDFITRLDVIGASGSVTFSVVPGSVSLNGVAQPNLTAAGFQLFSDGVLAGRPLTAGALTFTASALSGGTRALNRAGTAQDAVFTINTQPQTVLQSVLATQKFTLNGGKPGKDWLDLTATVNTGGINGKDFNGSPLTLRLGAQVFSFTFGAKPKDPNITASINNAQSSLHIHLKNQNFSELLKGLSPNESTQRLVIQLSLGKSFQGVELLQVQSRVRSGKVQFNYKLSKDKSLGGLFQILVLEGENFYGNLVFYVRFIIEPVGGGTVSADQTTVSIGPGFSQSFSGQGQRLSPPGAIQLFSIPNKSRTGKLLTFPLAPASVGISPTATGQAQSFLLQLDLSGSNGNFSGVAAEIIGPNFSFPIFVTVIIVPVDDGGFFFDFEGDGFDEGGDTGESVTSKRPKQ